MGLALLENAKRRQIPACCMKQRQHKPVENGVWDNGFELFCFAKETADARSMSFWPKNTGEQGNQCLAE